jgi:stress-induced morphogen
MIEPQVVKETIEQNLPDSTVSVNDLTGTKDHFEVEVISDEFEGVTLIKRHRMIYDALGEKMDGPIHALTLETKTFDEAS